MSVIATVSVLDGIMMLGLDLVVGLTMAAAVETLIISKLDSFVRTSAGKIEVGIVNRTMIMI